MNLYRKTVGKNMILVTLIVIAMLVLSACNSELPGAAGGKNGGDQGGNKGGNQGGDQGGDQSGSQGGDQGSDQSGGQGGSQGTTSGGNGSSQGGGSDGSTGGDGGSTVGDFGVRGSKQDPTDPCLDEGALPCGRGDHGQGNPVTGSLHANCRAAQGEVDPVCIEENQPTCEEIYGVGAPECGGTTTGGTTGGSTDGGGGCQTDCATPPPPMPDVEVAAAAPLTCPQWMLFHTFRDKNLEVYKLDGSTMTDISNSAGTDSRPSRSLDSTLIVFQSDRSGQIELFLVDANGQNVKQLTSVGDNINAMFGPDNNTIVYQSNRNGNWDIFVLDIAAGTERQLTTDQRNDTNPYWSPDGKWITYQSDRTGNDNVLVLNVETGEEFSVTRGVVNTVFPSWSPNGKDLAFLTEVGGVVYNLMISSTQGSDFKQITQGVIDTGNPAWSPEGNRIAYQGGQNGLLDIYTYDLTNDTQYKVTNGEGVNSGPSWDCGGQSVAFTSTRTGSPNLLSAAWQGGDASFLTNDFLTNKWVLWSPSENDLASRAH